jgi:phage gp29-like protein
MADKRDVRQLHEALTEGTPQQQDAQQLLRALNEDHRRGGDGSALPGWLMQKVRAAEAMKRDPAGQIPGMPPNFGHTAVPHVLSFQGLFGTWSRVYRASDEALKDSLENARFMRNDPTIMECVESRQRSVALLPWHLEPEDEKSHDQEDLCNKIEKVLNRIRRFTEYRRVLLEAIWYGRSGIQHSWNWNSVAGHMRLMPHAIRGQEDMGWLPIHGDKLVFRYDDGTYDTWPGQVGIRVGARFGALDRIMTERWAERVEPTDRGPAYFLTDYERDQIIIHKHMIEDGAYEDGVDAGTIHGVGIRSRIYWTWFQKQQALAFLMEYMERSAGGIEVWTYPWGNKDALSKVKAAAEYRISGGHNITFVPKPLGEDKDAYGVEFVEPGMQGIELLKELITDMYGHLIKRYIMGQVLSSETAPTGLGSGVSELHLDTLLQILSYDGNNLEETITTELVRRIKDWNWPSAKDIDIRFKIDMEEPDVLEKLESWMRVYEMGAALKERDVMDLVGAAIPTEDDKILQSAEAQAAQMGRDAADGNGDDKVSIHDSPDEKADQLGERLGLGLHGGMNLAENGNGFGGAPEKTPPGQTITMAKGGRFSTQQIPRGDTGERRRAKTRVLRRFGYRKDWRG